MLEQSKLAFASELSLVTRDVALPASEVGFAERYGRGKTSHTVHVWWARRPHSAMELLVKEVLSRTETGESPAVLDFFGGGGTIPFEVARVRGQAFSIDCNPLSVFIQKSLLEWSQVAFRALGKKNTLDLLSETGNRVLQKLAAETAWLFPLREKDAVRHPFVYFWSYQKSCSECGFTFRLSKRPWVSKKRGKSLYLTSEIDKASNIERVRLTDNGDVNQANNWRGRGGVATCPVCHNAHSSPSIKDMADVIDAVGYIYEGKRGKHFAEVPAQSIPPNSVLAEAEEKLLGRLGIALPKVSLPKWSGIVNPSLYGIETYADFLNPRQRLVLLNLMCLLVEEIRELEARVGDGVALFIGAALSGLIDQLVDWNCRLSMWIPQNEQVGRAFCGPGIPMLWDYAESDPASKGPANLWDKLNRIEVGIESLDIFDYVPVVARGQAQNLPFATGMFDAVITDPPYYDNIYYNILADFFFVWKRVLFAKLAPDLFENESTEDKSELVASTFRQGTPQAAHDWYIVEMGKALQEAARVLKKGGKLALVYSHSSVRGWEAILKSLRISGMTIDDVLPSNVERKARPRAMTSHAVNTCVAFMASNIPRQEVDLLKRDLDSLIELKALPLVEYLQQEGWDDFDIGIAALAECIAKLANVSAVEGMSDHEAINHIALVLQSKLPDFRIQSRGSL